MRWCSGLTVTTLAELDAETAAMWRVLTEAWSEQERHDAFVQRCFASGRLAAAGARYRAFLQEHPEDAIARRMRDRVVFLSMQALVSSERARVRPRSLLHSPWFVLVVLIGAAMGALLGFVWGGRSP